MADDPAALTDKGTAERGKPAPAPSEALLDACDRLRRLRAHFDMPAEHARRKSALAASPRGTQAYPVLVKALGEETQAMARKVAGYYQAHAPDQSLERDLARLREYLARQAQHMGLIAIRQRRALVEAIRARYADDRATNALAMGLSFTLVYRSRLPLCLTQELTEAAAMFERVDWSRSLFARAAPDTATEIREGMTRFLAAAEAEPGAAQGEDPEARARRHSKARNISRDHWTYRNTRTEDDDPFTDKMALLAHFDGHQDHDARLRALVQGHPILLGFNAGIVSAVTLANLLRLSDTARRNQALRGLIERILEAFEAENDKLAALYHADRPEQVDFGTLRPALQAAASFLVPGPDDDLTPALELCYARLDRWDRTDVTDAALIGAELALLCASFYFTGPVGAMVVSALQAGSAGVAVVNALARYDEFKRTRSMQDRDRVYAEMADTIGLIEAQGSQNAALLGVALELLGALPVARIARFASEAAEGPSAAVAAAMRRRKGNRAPPLEAPGATRADDLADGTAEAGLSARGTGDAGVADRGIAATATPAPPPAGPAPGLPPPRAEVLDEMLSFDIAPPPAGPTAQPALIVAERAEPVALDPRLTEVAEQATPYDRFASHERFSDYAPGFFNRATRGLDLPDAELDPLYENFVAATYGREVARRGLHTDLRPAAAQAFVTERRAILEAALGRPPLDRRTTQYTVRGAIDPQGRVSDQVLSVDSLIYDAGEVGGVPSVVHRLRFRRAEFQAIGIGDYEARFGERYAQANATIAHVMEQTGGPPMLLPSAIKEADLKPASRAFKRGVRTGSGFKVNIDEALSRFLDGHAIDLNQRVESDLINGIYSTADYTVADWARGASGADATVGYIGVIVEFY